MSDDLVKRLSTIAFYKHTSRDMLIHDCDLGQISMGDIQDALNRITAILAERDAARAEVAVLKEALGWYAKHVGDCRRMTPEGDAARKALHDDCGEKARAALANATTPDPLTKTWNEAIEAASMKVLALPLYRSNPTPPNIEVSQAILALKKG